MLHATARGELHDVWEAGEIEGVQQEAGFIRILLKEGIHVHEEDLGLVVGQGAGGGEGFLAAAATLRVKDQVIGLAEGKDTLLGAPAKGAFFIG